MKSNNRHISDIERADSLAEEIAESFGDLSNIERYRRICRTHDRQPIYRAYREAADMPLSKIKKSRTALFIYLLRKYAEEA